MNEYAQQPSIVINDPELRRSTLKFPVVGIGASAGGLIALTRMFENMPDSMDMAFVIVLHLSPEYESTADHIIQHVTRIPVIQVKERTRIEKCHVYIIAPKKKLLMNDGLLEVPELRWERGKRTAIDTFSGHWQKFIMRAQSRSCYLGWARTVP